jgi:hypothetical protein
MAWTHLDFPDHFILVDLSQPFDDSLAQDIAEIWTTSEITQQKLMSDEIHRLTQVIFPILGLLQLLLERFQAVFVVLQETDTFHVGHAFALLIIDPIR